jgi:hypothetical protein
VVPGPARLRRGAAGARPGADRVAAPRRGDRGRRLHHAGAGRDRRRHAQVARADLHAGERSPAAPYDPGLLRPRMVPSLVGLALRFVPGDAARA